MIKIKYLKQIDIQDWNNLVKETYKKTYNLQQQEGCMDNGQMVYLTIPSEVDENQYYEQIEDQKVNGSEMCVKFKNWLEKDSETYPEHMEKNSRELFWERRFYPCLEIVANDLHKRKLIEEGEYQIHINW